MGCANRVRKSTLVLCLLLASGACSGRRPFARREPSPLEPTRQAAAAASETTVPTAPTELAAWSEPAVWSESAVWSEPAAAMPSLPAYRSAGWTAPRRPRLWSMCQETRCKVSTDYQNFYDWDVTSDLLLAVAAASLLANTSLDQDFRDWYQDDVRSTSTDDFGDFWKTFGEGQIFIPAYAGLALVGGLCDQTRCGNVVGEFGWRSTRAYLVGSPPMLFMQACLGGSRPEEIRYASHWRPFEDSNGVSGHAFVGAVPFITAAKMTDNRWLKAGLYACSTFTAWSRVEHDDHYLSQACLGWWMAYLACRAVDNTQRQFEHLTLTPITTPNMVGVGAIYEW